MRAPAPRAALRQARRTPRGRRAAATSRRLVSRVAPEHGLQDLVGQTLGLGAESGARRSRLCGDLLAGLRNRARGLVPRGLDDLLFFVFGLAADLVARGRRLVANRRHLLLVLRLQARGFFAQ